MASAEHSVVDICLWLIFGKAQLQAFARDRSQQSIINEAQHLVSFSRIFSMQLDFPLPKHSLV